VVVVDAAGRAHDTIRYPETDGEIRSSILSWSCFAHSTVVMRASALKAVGGYRRAFLHAEDYDLWLRLIEVGEAANLSEPLTSLRTHEGQVTQAFLEQQVMSRLAAAAAARRRLSGGQDPLLSDEPVTVDTAQALELLHALCSQPWVRARWRRALAAYHWACARNAMSLGATRDGVLAAARATTLAPALLAVWMNRRVSRIARGARIVPPRKAPPVALR
jgi:hypothetical protein